MVRHLRKEQDASVGRYNTTRAFPNCTRLGRKKQVFLLYPCAVRSLLLFYRYSNFSQFDMWFRKWSWRRFSKGLSITLHLIVFLIYLEELIFKESFKSLKCLPCVDNECKVNHCESNNKRDKLVPIKPFSAYTNTPGNKGTPLFSTVIYMLLTRTWCWIGSNIPT